MHKRVQRCNLDECPSRNKCRRYIPPELRPGAPDAEYGDFTEALRANDGNGFKEFCGSLMSKEDVFDPKTFEEEAHP